MRRTLAFTALFVVVSSIAMAQSMHADSLWKAYQKNKQDTTLIQFYYVKSMTDYLTTNVDSGMLFSRKALALAQKIHYKKGEVQATSGIANFLNISGDLPRALKVSYEALPEAIKIGEWRTVANFYNLRGLTYSTLGDHKKALDNYYMAKNVVEKYHYNDLRVIELNNVARQYLDMNRLDSASYYTQKAYDFALEKKLLGNIGYLIRNFGIIQFKKGNLQEAIDFYKKSLYDTSARKNSYLQSEDYRRIAEAYQVMKKPDSTIDYAKKAYEQALNDRNPDLAQRATTLLTSALLLKGDYKAAFDYQQLTLKARDSLFSQQKTLQVQNLVYNEQQKQREVEANNIAYANRVRFYALLGIIGGFVFIAGILLFANQKRKKANSLLRQRNEQIEAQSKQLEKTLNDLKITQTQLIQSEKMASLGELTAGIAHEIQNPLNFVNNFSEVSTELTSELKSELKNGNTTEAIAIADDLEQNLGKIQHHGKRADFIVKGMLQHSRTSTGERQLTNINVLADEFFKLSFHGLRAKDKSFNAEMVTHFNEDVPKINIVQQDIGRVLLNLFNNAFYAVNQKKKTAGPDYKPTVEVSTLQEEHSIRLTVRDNGVGIPEKIRDKILQPFFTTKPTGEGTGLGLSLSYDILVKGHGGRIEIDTKEGEFTAFTVYLPLNHTI